MKKIFVTRRIPDAGLSLLQKHRGFAVRVWPKPSPIPRDALIKEARGCDAILSLLTEKIDNEVLRAAGPHLRIVANYAVGVDNIDLAAARERNIIVTNTPDVLNHAVAEHTIALMLAVARRTVEADAFTRAKKYKTWQPDLLLGVELSSKTIGIVGAGGIGSMVAQIAHAGFAMRVLYSSHHRNKELEETTHAKKVSLPTLLKKSDVITLHVPLTKETRHLISTRELASMKKTAMLINTSRGPVIDEKALLHTLTNKKIFGAGLDVFECEPAIDCDTRDRLELRKLANVIMTPHIASATHEARDAMAALAARNIIAVLNGKKPLTPIA